MTQIEIWKPFPFTDGRYEVSNLGRVRNTRNGYIKTHHFDARGYPRVNFKVDNQRKTMTVHSAMMRAFHGEPPIGCEVDHIDGNKRNNTLENLRYVSHRENIYNGVVETLRNNGRNQPRGEHGRFSVVPL